METNPSPTPLPPIMSPSSTPAPRALAPPGAGGGDPDTPPLIVRVALRTGRVTLLALSVVGFLAALTLYFGSGLELARFDAASKSAAQQQRLADDYNSHSASVTAMFGTPVELFVVMAVRAVVLRFFAPLVLRPHNSHAITAAALALSGAVGYLVNNGFNALNVQLHALPIEPHIVDQDLSIEDNFIFSAAGAETSNVGKQYSEAAPGNPLTNTVLRNLVLPFEPKPFNTYCDYEASQLKLHTYIPDDVLEFGIPQREWQSRVLPRALEPSQLRIVVNASKANEEVSTVDVSKLPMNASVAADLLLNALMLSSQYMPWGQAPVWFDQADVAERYLTPKAGEPNTSRVVSAAQIARVLPENASEIPERAQREWFLRETHAIVRRKFHGATNTSLSDIGVEFAHVDLTPSVVFDAVTFEVQVDPAASNATSSGHVVDNRTGAWHHLIDTNAHCGVSPALCAFMKPAYAAAQAPDMYVDTPVQIHAFAVCADETGAAALRATVGYASDGERDDRVDYAMACDDVSNASILLVSVAKRLVADALVQNASADALGVSPFPWDPETGSFGEYPLPAVATNLRKVFTFTVARLSWQLEDLALAFNASCDTTNPTHCLGLHYELQKPIVDDREMPPRQRLVVGNGALPYFKLTLPTYDSLQPGRLRPLSLVRVHEPPRLTGESYYPIITGDLLLPHNVKDVQWDRDMSNRVTGVGCLALNEDRQNLVLNNHMYMEHGLQATYTAGMFFLFQNAAVKDVISLSRVVAGGNYSAGGADGESDPESLAFKRNRLEVAVWISVPRQNVALTIAGCVLLLGGLVGAVVWAWCSARRRHVDADADPDPLELITTPHEIARVMLDEAWFPWVLLHRHVVDASDPTKHRRVSEFRIDALAMHHSRDEGHRVETKVSSSKFEC